MNEFVKFMLGTIKAALAELQRQHNVDTKILEGVYGTYAQNNSRYLQNLGEELMRRWGGPNGSYNNTRDGNLFIYEHVKSVTEKYVQYLRQQQQQSSQSSMFNAPPAFGGGNDFSFSASTPLGMGGGLASTDMFAAGVVGGNGIVTPAADTNMFANVSFEAAPTAAAQVETGSPETAVSTVMDRLAKNPDSVLRTADDIEGVMSSGHHRVKEHLVAEEDEVARLLSVDLRHPVNDKYEALGLFTKLAGHKIMNTSQTWTIRVNYHKFEVLDVPLDTVKVHFEKMHQGFINHGVEGVIAVMDDMIYGVRKRYEDFFVRIINRYMALKYFHVEIPNSGNFIPSIKSLAELADIKNMKGYEALCRQIDYQKRVDRLLDEAFGSVFGLSIKETTVNHLPYGGFVDPIQNPAIALACQDFRFSIHIPEDDVYITEKDIINPEIYAKYQDIIHKEIGKQTIVKVHNSLIVSNAMVASMVNKFNPDMKYSVGFNQTRDGFTASVARLLKQETEMADLFVFSRKTNAIFGDGWKIGLSLDGYLYILR